MYFSMEAYWALGRSRFTGFIELMLADVASIGFQKGAIIHGLTGLVYMLL